MVYFFFFSPSSLLIVSYLVYYKAWCCKYFMVVEGIVFLQESNRKYWDTLAFQWIKVSAGEKDYLITYRPLLYRETALVCMIGSLLVL